MGHPKTMKTSQLLCILALLPCSVLAQWSTNKSDFYMGTRVQLSNQGSPYDTAPYPYIDLVAGHLELARELGPWIEFKQWGSIGPDVPGDATLLYTGPSPAPGLIWNDNMKIVGNLWVTGTLITTTNIVWQTNILWVTNAFISVVASNSPDSNPLPWLAGTNVWTGTNTFNNTVNLNGGIFVQGNGGGTSNVPMGGITLHFVNGFYLGATP